MNEKDKIILQDSAFSIAEVIVSVIPALNIAWGLAISLFGAGIKLRQNRALEWVEMIRDHPSVFTQEILNDEAFQDGFVFMLESYIRERNEEKRKVARNIFLGFAKASDKINFTIEKFSHTLNQLSSNDLEVIADIDKEKASNFDAEGRDLNKSINYQIYGNINKKRENIYNLINLGILLDDTGSRLGHQYAPFVSLSFFGQKFMQFLSD